MGSIKQLGFECTCSMNITQRELDILTLSEANCHLGTKSCNSKMERYVYKRRKDGTYLINLGETFEKLQLAARIIAAIENPEDILVQSIGPYGEGAAKKFAYLAGAKFPATRHTPGTFTNQMQKRFEEPRLLIVSDPRTDNQSIKETKFVNIPVIAFCDTDSPLKNVDIAIPGNTKDKRSIGVLYYVLCRTVLQMKGHFRAREISTFQCAPFLTQDYDMENYQAPDEPTCEPKSSNDHTCLSRGDEEVDKLTQNIPRPGFYNL